MKFLTPDARFGATLESLIERRERAAAHGGALFGTNVSIRELIQGVIHQVESGDRVLEIDAGPGHFTKVLAKRDIDLTVLEPITPFVQELEEISSSSENPFEVYQGFTEDLPKDAAFDVGLVSFPARRGTALLALINEIAPIISEKIIVVLPDEGSLDWAYLTRACAIEGFKVRAEFYVENEKKEKDVYSLKRAVLVVIEKVHSFSDMRLDEAWDLAARTITVPYPVPRGAATRLVRYFIAGGDRAVVITTEPIGLNRLYGNLRTAAHRIARDEVTVRRTNDGIQLMLIPKID